MTDGVFIDPITKHDYTLIALWRRFLYKDNKEKSYTEIKKNGFFLY